MLSLLKIRNIALIDELELEFSSGLNLLTGETGSGKSIIVDSLGALTGERVTSDLIKQGAEQARIEGLFTVPVDNLLQKEFEDSGLEIDAGDHIDIIVRRELSAAGKNRIFINNQLATQAFLRKIGARLVDIHGQGEQATLFEPATHLDLLDEFSKCGEVADDVADKYERLAEIGREIEALREDEAQKLQLIDILKFQVDEIARANPSPGEDESLEDEKRRLANVGKLSTLSEESYLLLYENEEATVSTLEKVARRIEELAGFDSRFAEYSEQLASSMAVLEDLAFAVRDFRQNLEFSPDRLAEIEDRLAELSRLKRKYGGTIESVVAHLDEASERLRNIESAELRQVELAREYDAALREYLAAASKLHDLRAESSAKLGKKVEESLRDVSLEKARFEVRLWGSADDRTCYGPRGFDRAEFYFSANPGENPKPVAKVASGGELSRLMLVLNTTTRLAGESKTMVFDEIDTGIGGRVAEAVGVKLKELAKSQQVLCVTHQPQVATLADHHFVVSKRLGKDRTEVFVRSLSPDERVEEIARMLAGETITDTARQHAREMIMNSGK